MGDQPFPESVINMGQNTHSDHKGRTLNDIWGFSDEEIEGIHDFIQLVFPTNKKSQSVFNGFYLDSGELIDTLRANE